MLARTCNTVLRSLTEIAALNNINYLNIFNGNYKFVWRSLPDFRPLSLTTNLFADGTPVSDPCAPKDVYKVSPLCPSKGYEYRKKSTTLKCPKKGCPSLKKAEEKPKEPPKKEEKVECKKEDQANQDKKEATKKDTPKATPKGGTPKATPKGGTPKAAPKGGTPKEGDKKGGGVRLGKDIIKACLKKPKKVEPPKKEEPKKEVNPCPTPEEKQCAKKEIKDCDKPRTSPTCGKPPDVCSQPVSFPPVKPEDKHKPKKERPPYKIVCPPRNPTRDSNCKKKKKCCEKKPEDERCCSARPWPFNLLQKKCDKPKKKPCLEDKDKNKNKKKMISVTDNILDNSSPAILQTVKFHTSSSVALAQPSCVPKKLPPCSGDIKVSEETEGLMVQLRQTARDNRKKQPESCKKDDDQMPCLVPKDGGWKKLQEFILMRPPDQIKLDASNTFESPRLVTRKLRKMQLKKCGLNE